MQWPRPGQLQTHAHKHSLLLFLTPLAYTQTAGAGGGGDGSGGKPHIPLAEPFPVSLWSYSSSEQFPFLIFSLGHYFFDPVFFPFDLFNLLDVPPSLYKYFPKLLSPFWHFIFVTLTNIFPLFIFPALLDNFPPESFSFIYIPYWTISSSKDTKRRMLERNESTWREGKKIN